MGRKRFEPTVEEIPKSSIEIPKRRISSTEIPKRRISSYRRPILRTGTCKMNLMKEEIKKKATDSLKKQRADERKRLFGDIDDRAERSEYSQRSHVRMSWSNHLTLDLERAR